MTGLHLQPGVAAPPTGGILLVGENAPGSLLTSLQSGFAAAAPTTVMNPLASASAGLDRTNIAARVQRRIVARGADTRLLEAAEQLQPEVVVLIKGRGISDHAVREVRRRGTRVACWYPDNPFWRGGDPGALARLVACDVPVLWSTRQAQRLREHNPHVEVVPFGYDDSWFVPADPGGDRHGVAFLGTWSPRRERFLAALEGLPLIVAGTGWRQHSALSGVVDPVREQAAGEVLSRAVVGVNLLHPQCAGAHNMRTREIVAAGAAQVTDPGWDGTPLRDGDHCRWFDDPTSLRLSVERLLERPADAAELATNAQALVLDDTYRARGRELAALCGVG